MHGYRFKVDSNQIIRAWDSNIRAFDDYPGSSLIGVPYYQVMPRILLDGVDAVEKVLSDGGTINFKEYNSSCLFGSALGNLAIRPVYGEKQTIVGAEIIAETFSGCSILKSISQEQQSLEIDKKSMTLAHGVRNPLNAIKGAAVYLKEKYNDESCLVEFMEIIEEEISKLDSFITKFLSTSLLESEFSEINIVEMLKKIVALTAFQVSSREISLFTDFDDLPIVKGDVFLLEHAVLNIFNNAMEAMHNGGTINLSAKGLTKGQRNYIVIEVADTGPGISDNKIKDLSDGIDVNHGKTGRGFGLFITREIVQYHGGQLEIISRKDSGARVKILLPAKP
jgi:two-component system, NtrC family, nitrogen regulation sensor histidine kinase GlnL